MDSQTLATLTEQFFNAPRHERTKQFLSKIL